MGNADESIQHVVYSGRRLELQSSFDDRKVEVPGPGQVIDRDAQVPEVFGLRHFQIAQIGPVEHDPLSVALHPADPE